MNAPSITTSVYKYRRYAPWILGLYCVLLVALFFVSPTLPPVVVGIAATFLLLLPIYAAIKPKSIFSIRSVDDRKLLIGADDIIWDGLTIPVKDVAKLNIYLFAFENFQHRETGASGLRTRATEYGDQNTLSFQYQDKKYDFTFFLGNFAQYRMMLQIIQGWQKSGVSLSARTAFDYSEIEKWMQYFANKK